jgi:hypothetical protein
MKRILRITKKTDSTPAEQLPELKSNTLAAINFLDRSIVLTTLDSFEKKNFRRAGILADKIHAELKACRSQMNELLSEIKDEEEYLKE